MSHIRILKGTLLLPVWASGAVLTLELFADPFYVFLNYFAILYSVKILHIYLPKSEGIIPLFIKVRGV